MNMNTSFFSFKSGSPFMIILSIILGTLLMAYGIYEIFFKKDKREIKVNENESITLKEVMELKKEMAKIKEENEILKKAMAIFATRN